MPQTITLGSQTVAQCLKEERLPSAAQADPGRGRLAPPLRQTAGGSDTPPRPIC